VDNYYYYQAFRKTTVQFLDLFNGIKIRRFNQAGTFVKYVQVPIKYSPKEKIWYWLNERKDDEVLPIMSCQLNGVDYSVERSANKHQKISCTQDGVVSTYLNPVPYDINFQVSIWALYMYDIDQILEQILPWFQPYVMIRVYSPDLQATFDVKVIFTSATPEHEFEYSDDTFRILKYTLDFNVQTYMFKPIEVAGVIGKILMNFYTTEGQWNARDTTSTFTSAASGGEMMRFTTVQPWQTVDNDPIYDYELFSDNTKVGGADRVLNDLSVPAGYIIIQVPSAAGIEHILHNPALIGTDLYTMNADGVWRPHDEDIR
jgi:hypothetical protein